MMNLPQDVPSLIRELDKLYPEACPQLSDTDREIWYQVGQRSVVKRLLYLLKKQESANVLIKPKDP